MIQKLGRYLQDIDVATVSGQEEREEISGATSVGFGQKRERASY